jgi:DNA-binding beta-propeller fold protein YncE
VQAGGWGAAGTGPGQFASNAGGLATDRRGRLYIADFDNHRVQIFSSRGAPAGGWGAQGDDAGNFSGADDVAVAPDGRVWVADTGNQRVQLFSATGAPVTAVGTFDGAPHGVAVDADGNLYVAVEGSRLGGIRRYDHTDSGWLPLPGALIGQGGYRADDVEVSPDGSVYLITARTQLPYDDRLRRFTADGAPLGTVKLNQGDGTRGVAVDLDCNVWVGNSTNGSAIAKYSPAGKLLARLATPYIVNDIAVGPSGDLYVKIQNAGIVRYREDRSKVGAATIAGQARIAQSEQAASWVVRLTYVASGIACPDTIPGTARLAGTGTARALTGKAAVEVAAGRPTTIEIPLPKAALVAAGGTTVRLSFTIVLATNGRPTTQAATIAVRIPPDVA